MKKGFTFIEFMIVLTMIVLIFGGAYRLIKISYLDSKKFEVVTARIKSKDIKKIGDRDKYLIFTDIEVFENSDDWQFKKYDSSDFYNDIEIGKTYKLLVKGVRRPRWSMYRNIVKYELIEDE